MQIYIWEWGIPVVMKHISEPDMFSMPYVTKSPDGKVFLGQSMNNEIHVYGAKDRFAANHSATSPWRTAQVY